MTWAGKRKFLYFLGFLTFLLVVIATPLFFILRREPTCFDFKQNQGEKDIDCGGPCLKLCSALELEPAVLWHQAFKVATGTYTAVAYIKNPNLNAESVSVPYVFTLYDENNKIITERKGKTTIPAGGNLPGQNFTVFESGILVGEKVPIRTTFDLSSEFTWTLARQFPQVTVVSHDIQNPDKSPLVTAKIENKSLTPLGIIDVTAIVYDVAGNAFAPSKTVIDRLDAQSTAEVIFTWPQSFTKSAARVEIIPIPR